MKICNIKIWTILSTLIAAILSSSIMANAGNSSKMYLRILSYNLFLPPVPFKANKQSKRLAKILNFLTKYRINDKERVDIIYLQEVFRNVHRQEVFKWAHKNKYLAIFPHNEFNNYKKSPWKSKPTWFVGVNNGGLIILVSLKSGLKCKSRAFKVPYVYLVQLVDGAVRKGFIKVSCIHNSFKGFNFSLWNTHAGAKSFNKSTQAYENQAEIKASIAQLKQLRKAIRLENSDLAILGGDLNFPTFSELKYRIVTTHRFGQNKYKVVVYDKTYPNGRSRFHRVFFDPNNESSPRIRNTFYEVERNWKECLKFSTYKINHCTSFNSNLNPLLLYNGDWEPPVDIDKIVISNSKKLQCKTLDSFIVKRPNLKYLSDHFPIYSRIACIKTPIK